MKDIDDVLEETEITSIEFVPTKAEDPNTWEPARKRLRPDFTGALVLADDEFTEADSLRFLGDLAEGYGPEMIGLSLGWSPAKTKRFVGDVSRSEIIQVIRESLNESVEHAILTHARQGNSTALKLWAYNKMADRYADRREVRTHATSQAELVVSVRAAMNERTRELVEANGQDAVAALQRAFHSDDSDIIEAEIVD